jgi:hypothetical protein
MKRSDAGRERWMIGKPFDVRRRLGPNHGRRGNAESGSERSHEQILDSMPNAVSEPADGETEQCPVLAIPVRHGLATRMGDPSRKAAMSSAASP